MAVPPLLLGACHVSLRPLPASLLAARLRGGDGAVGAGGGDGVPPPPVPAKPATCDLSKGECGTYGTTIEFRKTPQSAAARALKEEKLVFVLHVSGHFEDPRFT